MQIERTKNASRNIFFGFILKIYQLLVPFIFRSVIIYTLGVEYLGLNGLFTSILQVLNLAELGVGNAMVFSMYEPIVKDDTKKICALMKLYQLYYRVIGFVILILGIALVPMIPYLIDGTVPANINLRFLYLLHLIATVLTYWLFAYRNSVLLAYQRTDVGSKVTIVSDTIKYLFQLVALFVFNNYYYFVIAILLSQIINNCLTALISKKMYPQYSPKGTISEEEKATINQRIKDLFTSKFGATIVNSVDTIVISAFLGLKMLAMYQNYYYVLSAIFAVFSIVNSSVVAGIGNSLITTNKDKNYRDFQTFSLIQFILISFSVSCLIVLYQPFMKLWMGKDLLFDFPVVVLLCVYFIGYELVMMFSVYKDAAGIWHQDRYRPLITGLVNLVFNLVLVKKFGIYGIIFSTILSQYFISIPWILHNVFSQIFNEVETKNYLKKIVFYFGITAVIGLVFYYVSGFVAISSLFGFIGLAFVSIALSIIINLLAFSRFKDFNEVKRLSKRILNRN